MPHHDHAIEISGPTITTGRMRLRPWTEADAEPALEVFGNDEVARWLAPAMTAVPDAATMRDVLRHWSEEQHDTGRPTGRWAFERADTGGLIGAGAVLPLPPEGDDLEIGWQLAPDAWGQGYAAEAGHALAHYAFSRGEDEVFAVVRPRQHPRRRHRAPGGHGVGRRDRQVLRPAAAGLPAAQGRHRRTVAPRRPVAPHRPPDRAIHPSTGATQAGGLDQLDDVPPRPL